MSCLKIKQKRERSENWGVEEKQFLIECIRQNKNIIESKSNDLSINKKRKDAWKEIECMFKANGYEREINRIKEQWRRMKCQSKETVTKFEKSRKRTGGGSPPADPSAQDWEIKNICPDDFMADSSKYDSDAALTNTENIILEMEESNNLGTEPVLILNPLTGLFEPDRDPFIPPQEPHPESSAPSHSNVLSSVKKSKNSKLLQMTEYERELLKLEQESFKKNQERESMLFELKVENIKKKMEMDEEVFKLRKERELLEIQLLRRRLNT